MWMSEEWVLASSELSVTVPYNYCFESNCVANYIKVK